ncbi:MAG: TauD/TfdA family dioxygenase [Pseudomonadota bacterium]
MRINSVERDERALKLAWEDGTRQELPYIWLRDNDPGELHPDTKERIFDLTSVSLDIQPREVTPASEGLRVRWPDRDEDSIYPLDWLIDRRLENPAQDPAIIEKISWRPESMTGIPTVSAKQCFNGDGLLEALTHIKQSGIVIINELDDDPAAGERFGDLIGFKRESNFGVMFDVISKADPNNLAYTSIALPLHTDLPNQEFVPGIQFLHCYKNSATGGGSVFADGMAITEDFKTSEPEHYALLCETDVPWRFHDDSCDVRRRRAIIGLDKSGKFESFTFNAHLADVIDLPPEQIYPFYAAYQALMARIRSNDYNITHQLQPGEMVIFDNLRVMHGRESFDPTTGDRHLRGYYIEHNEVESCIRMRSKQQH